MADDYASIIKGLPVNTGAAGPAMPATAQPASVEVSPYAAIINERKQREASTAQGNLFVGAQANPDEAGKAAQIGKTLGVAPQIVEQDLPTYELQHRMLTGNAAMRENPVLMQWAASNPDAVRIAHDDFANLGTVAKVVTSALTGYDKGIISDQLARVNWAQLKGGETAELTKAERELRLNLSRPDGIDNKFYATVKNMGSFIGGLVQQGGRSVTPAAAGGAIGAIMGTLGGPLAPATSGVGTLVGTGAGFLAGMAREGFEQGAGQLYGQLKNERDANGNPLDPNLIVGASLSGGLFLGALNATGVNAAGKPFAAAMSSFMPEVTKTMVTRPTIASALLTMGKGVGKGAATGAAFGVASQSIMVAAEQSAKLWDSGQWDTVMNSEAERAKAVDSIVTAAEDMALTFAVLHAPASGLGLVGDFKRASEASTQRDFIKGLAEGSISSKLRERSPDTFRNFVAAQTDGTPVESLHIPAERILELYQEAGIEPGKAETDHLFPFVKDMQEQLRQAQPVNGDVVIPTADYATHIAGTEVDKKLRDHIKVGSDAMSIADAKVFFQDYKKNLDELTKGAKDVAVKETDSAEQIRVEVSKQLEDIGYKPRTAGGMAAQMAAFFRTIGVRTGIDPLILFSDYIKGIGRPKAGESKPEGAMDQLQNPFPESKFPGGFHGTVADFEKFDLSKTKNGGIWMHEDANLAQRNSIIDWGKKGQPYKEGARMMPVHADIKNPYRVTAEELDKIRLSDDPTTKVNAIVEKAKAAGHDGIDWREGAWMAFDPKQVRSASSGQELGQPAYHGSPHIFDEFKLNKIGTGEGAQAFGWGLYFASNKDVAKWYRDQLASDQNIIFKLNGVERKAFFDGSDNNHTAEQKAISRLYGGYPESKNWVKSAKELLKELDAGDEKWRPKGGERKVLEGIADGSIKFEPDKAGRLYHVEIPEHENFLNRDLPLSEQPEPVRKALIKAGMMPPERGFELDDYVDELGKKYGWEGKEGEVQTPAWKDSDLTPEELTKLRKLQGVETITRNTPSDDWLGRKFYDELAKQAETGGPVSDWANANKISTGAHSIRAMNEELASRYLNSIGIPGMSYLEGAARKKGKGKYNYILFDDSQVKITGYEQKDKAAQSERRGYIQIGHSSEGKLVSLKISLLEKADLSTFLHESGHAYLEILRDLAKTHDELKGDLDLIHKYLGVEEGADLTREQHEKFARSFEAYLMEGKAPSTELRGAFQRFKSWLTTIYEKITNLDVQLTDEVRGAMDRMLATSEEITTARRAQRLEALFTDAKTAGMTDAEFTAYKRSVRKVSESADDKLLEKVMGDIRRQRTSIWKAEKARVEEEVGKKVDERKDMQALAALRDGDVKLSRSDLTTMYGDDVLADLPAGRPGSPLVVSAGGVHPDAIAERFGYRSGDAMVKALVALERKQRKIRAVDGEKRTIRQYLIDEETTRRMNEEHGNMLDDGSIKEEAVNALHSNGQAEILATELRALGRTSGKPTTPLRVARAWAKDQISSRRVKDATSAWKYARDEAKAGAAVVKALLDKDNAEAFRQKQLQMLNHVLFMEARDAAKEIDSGTAMMNRLANADKIKGLDGDYLEQVHGLLERFNFRQMSGAQVERAKSLREWAEWRRSLGDEVKVPEKLFNEAFRKHYTDMTVDEFRGLADAVTNIVHLGRLKDQLIDRGEKRALAEVVDEAANVMMQLRQADVPLERNPGVGGKGLDRLSAKWLNFKTAVAGMDAALLKMEQVFDWLDRNNPDGVFNRIIFKRISEAAGRENDMRTVIAKKLRALNESMSKEFKRDFTNRYDVPELIDSRTGQNSSMLKSEILAMALNVGNDSNFDKLMRGEKWAESSIRAVLDRHMTEDDWKFVSGIWRMLEDLWPQIADMERKLSGVVPERVQPRAVDTKFGKIEGGYYPLIYDPLRAYDVELNRQRNAESLFENNYTRATTSHGHTIERVSEYARPLLLSMSVLPRHLTQVTHDLAYREAIMDADRFLSNRHIREGVEKSLGREVYQQFRPWLQAIANDRVYDERGLAWWDRTAHWARINATMVGLGFRFSTMLIHGASAASNSVGELGPRWMASGAAAFFGTPKKMAEARDFIYERSSEMRHRMDSIDRDVRDGLMELEGKKGVTYAVRRFAFYGISALDMASALPTWMGSYNRAMSLGHGEEQAAYMADKSVRNAHGAGQVKDIAAVQRGSEWMKLGTMFYSFWSHFYNRQRDLMRKTADVGHALAEGDVKSAARDFSMVLSRSLFYFVIPQLIHAALRSKSSKDDEKEWGELAAEEIGLGFFAGIPIVRDVARAAIEHKDYEATPAAHLVKTILQSGKDVAASTGMSDSELSDKWVRHSMETAGYVFGLPLGQPAGSTQFLWDVMDGTQSPQDLQDWVEGIMYGKMKERQ